MCDTKKSKDKDAYFRRRETELILHDGVENKPKKIEAFIEGDELSGRIEEAYGLQQKYYS